MGPDVGAASEPTPPEGFKTADPPRTLCDVHAVLVAMRAAPPGVAWKLTEAGRQLDANLLRLVPGQTIDTHTEPDLDVLIVIIAGSGALTSGGETLLCAPGELVWLPRGCTRNLTAGPGGLAYLTVHQRRPGMRIRVGR